MRDDRHEVLTGYIEEEMKMAYVDYAMSVIVGRALPDARDGLKPVHRRILYAMKDMGLTYRSAHKKCARIVGEVLGKYHPHGDSAVYDALVRMAQYFSLRYPLVDGQGNFGSVDGDSPAAMRYTEAKMEKIADEMLQDLDKDTVEWADNFDASLQEPEVLPAKLPNLLVNGSSGIAVGMTTNVPPHNLTEVCEAAIALIDNPSLSITDLMDYVQGPDFPTGGIVAGVNGLVKAYKTGRGKVKVQGQLHHDEDDKIIVDEIPYMVNKAKLIQQIADAVKNDRIEGISDLRDESDRDGMRVVIELKRGATPELVENQLLKHTNLSTTFSIRLIALVDNEPKPLSLKELLNQHINHRKEVVVRRTEHDLKKAEQRSHILEGLLKALNNIDDVIETIRAADSVDDARDALMESYNLSDDQADAVLNMRLQKLASLERQKVKDEHADLQEKIARYKEILNNEDEVESIVKDEYRELIADYGDDRQTEIHQDYANLEYEDLIEEEDVVVTMTARGYVKRLPIDTYRAQHRGGKGIIGTKTKEEDAVQDVFIANSHSYLLIFTDEGQVYWKKVYRIPEGSRTSQGTPIINLIDIDKDESVRAVIPVQEFEEDKYLLTATKNGIVKKTPLSDYGNPRRGGIIALGMKEDDMLVNVTVTEGDDEIILATKKGMAIRFHEGDVRPMGRTARGVIGIRLEDDDHVIGMVDVDEDKEILTITENGYGKRTPVTEYRKINRGGKGVINMKTTERNGNVVEVKSVSDDDDVIIISKDGIIIRTRSGEVSSIGRNTQGVRVMRLEDDDHVVAAAKVAKSVTDGDQ
jgi:DNA gyrase subunit A